MAPNYGEESRDPKRIVPRAVHLGDRGKGRICYRNAVPAGHRPRRRSQRTPVAGTHGQWTSTARSPGTAILVVGGDPGSRPDRRIPVELLSGRG